MISISTLGHLAADPAERDTSTGGKFVAFPLATNSKDGKTTTYLSCRAFGTTAKTIMQYLKKGAQILIYGTVYELSTYKSKTDETIKPNMSVTIDRFEFCNSKDKSERGRID